MNYCRSCSTDFASVSAFDRHRTGTHDYTYSEGAKMEPVREDGRRCMGAKEMQLAGMRLDERGRWRIVADAERIARWAQKAA